VNSNKQIQNSRVLITGGAGFIGSNLCEELLKQNNQVICLDNLITGKYENISHLTSNKNFKFIEGDICHFETCKKATDGIDYVLHQAALGSVPRSINEPIITNNINISGFLNIIEASKQSKIKRFVYAASSSTYGDSTELPKVEDKIGRPLSPYAITKYVNELYADVYSRLYDFESIGLRYFNVFGRKQDPDGAYAAAVPKFITAFLQAKSPEIYGDGSQTRDFTYIDNVIHANQMAALTDNSSAINQVYNIAYGESNTLNQVIDIIKKYLAELKPEVSGIPTKYSSPRKGDILHSLASIEKAKKMLGYEPEYDFEKGIKKAIKWYSENLSIKVEKQSAK
jgi:UDP-N-acetylglucosamine/UDP-N-acetylgalactosamine 4-epimerase